MRSAPLRIDLLDFEESRRALVGEFRHAGGDLRLELSARRCVLRFRRSKLGRNSHGHFVQGHFNTLIGSVFQSSQLAGVEGSIVLLGCGGRSSYDGLLPLFARCLKSANVSEVLGLHVMPKLFGKARNKGFETSPFARGALLGCNECGLNGLLVAVNSPLGFQVQLLLIGSEVLPSLEMSTTYEGDLLTGHLVVPLLLGFMSV